MGRKSARILMIGVVLSFLRATSLGDEKAGEAPVEEGLTPAEEGLTPAEEGLTPAEEGLTPVEEGFELVWSDEFEKDGRPDERNWTFERGFVRNQELQWYQPENARCKGGLLIIEGRRERVENPRYSESHSDWKRNRKYADYTSASLRTKGLHQWKYGRFEMRGRIDVRPGLWPAYWTLGSARPWPGCGEIDIMEFYRGTLLANACWGSGRRWRPVWDTAKKKIAEFAQADWEKKFHLWRMDWNEKEIKLYVDDILLNSIDLDKTFNGDRERANPFREPHYMILNQAIGGSQGGNPSGTEFPARFEVDYVRVYQKKAPVSGDRTYLTR